MPHQRGLLPGVTGSWSGEVGGDDGGVEGGRDGEVGGGVVPVPPVPLLAAFNDVRSDAICVCIVCGNCERIDSS